MARGIEWTEEAEKSFKKTLRFYTRRNGSNKYSKKVNNVIKQLCKHLKRYPLLGMKTTKSGVRVIITSPFQIYYTVRPQAIVILNVWDTRRDPDELIL